MLSYFRASDACVSLVVLISGSLVVGQVHQGTPECQWRGRG